MLKFSEFIREEMGAGAIAGPANVTGPAIANFDPLLVRKTRKRKALEKPVTEEGGAGEWGTDKLANRYADDTPGQPRRKKKRDV